jgi:hypothetical protein
MDFQEGIFILNAANAAVNSPAVAMYVCAIIRDPAFILKASDVDAQRTSAIGAWRPRFSVKQLYHAPKISSIFSASVKS